MKNSLNRTITESRKTVQTNDTEIRVTVVNTEDSLYGTLFTVGNGIADADRSNAFDVYTDGHAELMTMGTTDNSVVIKKTLDDYAKKDDLSSYVTSDDVNTTIDNKIKVYASEEEAEQAFDDLPVGTIVFITE